MTRRHRTRRYIPLAALVVAWGLVMPAHAAPGDILFSDDFEDGAVSPWTVEDPNQVGVGTHTANSGSYSMYLRHDFTYSDSPAFNANVPDATVSVWVRRGSDAFSEYPDSGEDLRLEYQDAGGNWNVLATFPGGGPEGEIFEETFQLPDDALHANLKVSFLMTFGSGSDFDYWHVDDVVVTEGTAGTFCSPDAPLSDSFEDGSLDSWQAQGPGDAGVSFATADHGTQSAFVAGRRVNLRSTNVDLSAATSADLSLWIRRGDDSFSEDPDSGEDLLLQYLDSGNNWTTLQTFTGAGTPGEIFTPSFSLPADALHNNFRLRFEYLGGQNNADYWHIDSICLQAGGAIGAFAIDVGGGSASTCSPFAVTITALNNGGNVMQNYDGLVDITTSSGHGTWSINTANGTLSDPTADDGAAQYQWVQSDDGQIILDLSNVHADDLTITVTDTNTGDSGTSSTLSFRDNAFVVSLTDALGAEVVAARPHAMEVAMWTRDSGGNCSIATSYDVSPIKASLTPAANDPAGAAGPTINGSAQIPDGPSTTNVTLSFTNGVASFNLDTTDVGKYSLNLLDDSRTFATGVDIQGSSPTVTVRPFALYTHSAVSDTGTANPGANTPGGGLFHVAGGNFQLDVTAVAWQGADDGDNDGVPDSGSDLSNNNVTPSFAADATVDSTAPFAPSAAVGGSTPALLNGAVAAADFTGGTATPNGLQYPEVGAFTSTATASDYLTAGVNVPGGGEWVGRFTPADFTTSWNTPQFGAGCAAGTNPFTYVGEGFTYATQPVLTVTALNANSATTGNYADFSGSGGDNWFKITSSSLQNRTYQETAAGAPSLDTSGLPGTDPTVLAGTPDPSTPALGTGELTFSAGTGLAYDRDAEVADFNASIDLSIDVIDADNIAYSGNPAQITDIDFDNGNADSIRYGRIEITDAVGASRLDLNVPMAVMYYDGANDGFVANTDDQCTDGVTVALDQTNLAGSTCVQDSTGDSGGDACGTAPAGQDWSEPPNTDGSFNLWLQAPGAGNTGYVDITSGIPTWLRWDWDNDGLYSEDTDDEPAGRATFGIYQAPDSRIYIRDGG